MIGEKTAAVTGATGFLGSHLCRRLLEEGWTVRGLSRAGSDRGDLETDLEWTVGDISDRQPIDSLVDGADVVFHLAGVGLWDAGPETVWDVNFEGTKTVVSACREADVGRLLFTSTSGTLRTPAEGGIATEADRAEPIGAYQSSKAAAERVVDRYTEAGGDAVTVHPTSIFGPGDGAFSLQLITMATDPKMVAHLPGGLSIVGVSDVVEGILAAAEDGTSGEHYILGGENLRYDDALRRIADTAGGTPARVRVPPIAIHAAGPVASAVSTLTGRRIFPFDGDMAQLATQKLFYSSEKAFAELGYTYEPLEAHVEETMAWYESTSAPESAPTSTSTSEPGSGSTR